MSLLDKMVDVIKESRRTFKEPIFLKDFSNENKQLNDSQPGGAIPKPGIVIEGFGC